MTACGMNACLRPRIVTEAPISYLASAFSLIPSLCGLTSQLNSEIEPWAAKQKARPAITSRACGFASLRGRGYQFLMSSSVFSRASGPIDQRSKSGFFGL